MNNSYFTTSITSNIESQYKSTFQQNNARTTPQSMPGTPSENNSDALVDGYLQILTQDNVERRNLAGVNVTVLSPNQDKVWYELVTDVHGLTKVVTLPAPPIIYSLDRKALIVPYANYTVKIKYAGYSSIIYQNVHVYASTTFLQICYLTLLPEVLDIKTLPPNIIVE